MVLSRFFLLFSTFLPFFFYYHRNFLLILPRVIIDLAKQENHVENPSEISLLMVEISGLKAKFSELSTKVQALEVRPKSSSIPTWNPDLSLSENMGNFEFLESNPSTLIDILLTSLLTILALWDLDFETLLSIE